MLIRLCDDVARVSRFPVKQILFTCLAGPKKDHVCYTTEDAFSGNKTCHVLRCTNPPRAVQVHKHVSSLSLSL